MSITSSGLPRLEEPGDAELISAVRGGDVDAYGELFTRHVEAARRLARQLVSGGDVDDLVSEAFAKVLVVLQRGGGPDLAFRAYLLTAVRRLHVDRIRANARLTTTDDLTPFDPGVPFRDTAVEGFESGAAARAFASLPERWQMVLWHTEVEGQKPADVAPLLGMSANSVSALAYRAREGLRQAFLSMHVQEVEDSACTWTHDNLGAYVRHGVSRRDAARIEEHLTECRPCTAVYLELTEVNSELSGILAPLLLGGLASAYVASATGGVAAKGGVLLLLDRARDLVVSHAPASAVAGVAATAVLGGAVLMTLGPGDRPDDAGRAPAAAPGTTSDSVDGEEESGARQRPGARQPREGRGSTAGGSPADLLPTAALTEPPAPLPTLPADPTAPPATPPPGPPSGQPSGTPEPPSAPAADLRVTASAGATGPATYAVRVSVAGLDDGETAVLSVTGDPSVVLTSDGRCELLAVGTGTCAVTRTPTSYDFTAVAPEGATLTFTVTGDAGDPGANNRAVVRLGS